MSRWHRAAAALLTSGALLFTAAGCGTSITVNGAKLIEPETALAAALDALKSDNDPGIQNGSITVSGATSCFYVKTGADSDDITKQAACGPIRRLGQPDDKVWDTYALEFAQNSDGDVTASVGGQAETGVAVDTSLLTSGGDTEPAAVDEVPAPKAPPTTITNTALTISSAENLGSFTPLEKPAKLITPAGTVEVTEAAEPEFVPQEMVEGSEDPSGVAPYYRPAEGQKLYAYKIKIGPSPESTVPASTADNDNAVNLDTALTVGIGQETINITDAAGDSSGDTLSLSCETEGYNSSFPCVAGGTSEAILLMTVPAEGAPSLVATVNGDAQSVDLSTGELTSSVSQVEYDHEKLSAEVGETLKGQVEVKEKDETEKTAWTVKVTSASLSAFDPYRGWAPDGKAWLIIGTEGYEPTSDASGFDLDRMASFTTSVDGTALQPDGLTDAGIQYTNTINWAYQVPADTTKVTVSFQPTGEYQWFGDKQDFTAKTAATHDISLPS